MEKRSARVRGAGRAFESLRDYRPGDELRDICWTASARRAKLVTRLYEIERSQTVWIVIDAGRLMRARVDGLSKLDHAVNAALALAQVALGSGDRVGVLAYGRRITLRLPASQGSTHLRHIVERLARLEEDDWEGDHLLAAGRLLADQKRRSLIVWITDLSETAMTPEVVRAATQLMTRHVVLFVVIGEPDLRRVAERRPGGVHEMYESAAAQEVVHRRERLLAQSARRRRAGVRDDVEPARRRARERVSRRQAAEPLVEPFSAAGSRLRRGSRYTTNSAAIAAASVNFIATGRSVGETNASMRPAMMSIGTQPSDEHHGFASGLRERIPPRPACRETADPARAAARRRRR